MARDDYVPLFPELLDSSIMEEPVETRFLWVAMLLMADKTGLVRATIQALARRANMDRGTVKASLASLMEPDPNSTNQDEEGRRILQVGENEYQLVTWAYYRQQRDIDKIRAAGRERYRRWKERQEKAQPTVANVSGDEQTSADPRKERKGKEKKRREGGEPPLTPPPSSSKKSRFRPPALEEVTAYCKEKSLTEADPETFVDFYASKNWMVGKNKMSNWKSAVSGWHRRAMNRKPKTEDIVEKAKRAQGIEE